MTTVKTNKVTIIAKKDELVAVDIIPTKVFGINNVFTGDGETQVSLQVDKKFVPSFDKEEQEEGILILHYSNAKEDAPGTVLITGRFDLTKGQVVFTGEGFDSVELIVEELEDLPAE